MLEEYGLKLDDTLLVDAEKEPEKMGLYDDLIKNRNAKLIPGGAAQNTARGAQYMLGPDSVWYIGSVGDDEYSKLLREKCAEQGTSLTKTEYDFTACCFLAVFTNTSSSSSDVSKTNTRQACTSNTTSTAPLPANAVS